MPDHNADDKNPAFDARYTLLRDRLRDRTLLVGPWETVFPRIESRRLHAEYKLRKTLQGFWLVKRHSGLDSLRPCDLLTFFQAYAETTFKAAGEEGISLFHTLASYESYLGAAHAWVLKCILPEAEPLTPSGE